MRRTVHSFLINSTNHLKNGGTYNRLIVDEALMVHAGEILYAVELSQAKEVMMVGDMNQIPYINRVTGHSTQFHDITKITEISQYLSHSYRCTMTVACILSKYYSEGMTTSSNVKRELVKHVFDNINSIPVMVKDTKMLVFKQTEKAQLLKLGHNVSTIHEYQGKQAPHIVVVRTSSNNEDIYNSVPHCLVAISLHTQSFTYIAPTQEDILTKWIRYGQQCSEVDLAKHHKEMETTCKENNSIGKYPFLPHRSMERKDATKLPNKSDIGGASQTTSTKKLNSNFMTGGDSQTTSTKKLNSNFMTGGDSQTTSTKKLNSNFMTGGDSQTTSTKKLNSNFMTGGDSQTTSTKKLNSNFMTGGDSQTTSTKKLNSNFMTGGDSQTTSTKKTEY
ncbi:hypothetical protein J6590_059707 [Homalodisca vitripennis]|nr:hypothetical protein J6590_059707 [Homalodisca vitripennis]